MGHVLEDEIKNMDLLFQNMCNVNPESEYQFLETIRYMFRSTRKKLKFTQEKVANDLMMSQEQISQIETGKRTPSVWETFNLCSYYYKRLSTVTNQEGNK